MAQSTTISLDDDSNSSLAKESAVEFVREIEVETCKVSLKLSQYSVGDEACVVWDAGMVLGKYFDYLTSYDSGYKISGKSVVDLGSGTGVVGLFAAALGANVILTDLPDVIPLLQKNIDANKSVLSGSVSASVLSWGESVEELSSPDVLVASDCIYYDMCVTKLIPTLTELSSEKTDVFISYEDRTVGNAKELVRSFLEELRKSFDINIIPRREQHPDFQSRDIHLLKCKKKHQQQGG